MNRAVFHFLRANQRSLAEMLLSSLLVNAFALTLPLFAMLVYDKAMGNEIHDTLWALAGGVLLMFAMELVLRTSRIFIIEHAGAQWDTHLDERLMRGVLAAPMSQALSVGVVLSRYRELSSTRDVLSAQCLLPLADLPFLVLFVLVVAAIGGPMVFIPLGMGATLIAVSACLQAISQRRQRDSLRAHTTKLTWLVDVLTARESLMSQAASSVAINGFRQPAHAGARAAAKARLWSQISQQITPVAMSLTSVILLVVGVFRVEAQALSVGGLISINLLSGRILSLLCTIAPMLAKWKDFTKALHDLHETVNFNADAPDKLDAATNALKLEGLRLDGVSFSFPANARSVLDGLNLQLRAGELVAVVGSSGAGKSTLLRLLAGHISPTQGQYAYGGHLIDSDRQRRWLGAQVNYKPQDPSYLGGTLAEIIAPGEASRNDAVMLKSLRKTGLGQALDRNELALNTLVGTNGVGLSGGQRQMLAMARVFQSNQDMVLLDEPTLGLDRTAQEHVLRELRPMAYQGRCVVVATHAAEVIELADRVLVLDRGRLVADAPPGRLLANKPVTQPHGDKSHRDQGPSAATVEAVQAIESGDAT